MYEISVIKSVINLYRHLYDINIKGNKRINIIINTFGIHINTLYNWLKIYIISENKNCTILIFTYYIRSSKHSIIQCYKELQKQ